MLVAISAVTVLCSSTAAAVEPMNSFTPSMALLIALSEVATSPAMPLRESISFEMVSVALLA
jgi:hypothetical protein